MLGSRESSAYPDLKVDGSGTDQSFRVKWNGSITNNTGKEWHKVTFCGKGFEAEDKPLLAAGEPCLLRLWMYAWKPGAGYKSCAW